MARPTRRLGEDAARKRIQVIVGTVVVIVAVGLTAWPRLTGANRRHVAFARTRIPASSVGEAPFAVQFTPDGEKVLVVSRDALRVFVPDDLARGDALPLFTINKTEDGQTFEGAYLGAVSGNGRELVIVRQLTKGPSVTGAELDVIAIESARIVERIALEPVTSLALSHNGMRALVGTSKAELWDLAKGTRLLSLEVSNGPVCGIQFSPDEKQAVFGYPELARTTTWDLGSQETRQTDAHLAPAIFAFDGAHVLGFDRTAPPRIGSGPGAVLWEHEKGESVALDPGAAAVQDVRALARLGGGKRVVGVDDQHVIVWDLESRKVVRVMGGVKPEIGAFETVCADPHGDSVVIGTHKGELIGLDLAD